MCGKLFPRPDSIANGAYLQVERAWIVGLLNGWILRRLLEQGIELLSRISDDGLDKTITTTLPFVQWANKQEEVDDGERYLKELIIRRLGLQLPAIDHGSLELFRLRGAWHAQTLEVRILKFVRRGKE